LWIGLAAAEVYGHAVSDRLPLWFCRRAGGLWKPEYRLYCLWAPVTILAIGLGLFGAALQYHVHFMVLALGAFFIWSGAMSIVPVTMTYLCETFADHVPEVSAIMGLYRLALGLSTPFFATAWISKVTVGWLFGMAACFTIPAFGLICVLIWKGPQIRMLSPNRFKPSDKKFNISGSDVV
jgi:MFS family permease